MTNQKVKAAVVLAAIWVLSCCYGSYHGGSILQKDAILENVPRLEKYISNEMKRHDIEKVSVAIVHEGEVIYTQGFNASVDELFQAASISKPVVAYAALKLVEDGKLGLDVPLSNYTTVGYLPGGSKGNEITLRMILSHTSGMNNDTSGRDRTVYSEPGEEFHYSGAGFEFLRYVLENVTRTPFDAYMEQSVLAPLGMVKSRFSIENNGKKYPSAAGGLVSTAEELARFLMELMNPKFISLEMAREMLSDSIVIDEHNAWGLGIGIQHGGGRDSFWHTGNNGNRWWSLAFFSVEDQTGIVVMTKGADGYRIYQDIAYYAIGGSYYGTIDVISRSAIRK